MKEMTAYDNVGYSYKTTLYGNLENPETKFYLISSRDVLRDDRQQGNEPKRAHRKLRNRRNQTVFVLYCASFSKRATLESYVTESILIV